MTLSYKVVTTEQELKRCVTALSGADILAYDIETTGLNPIGNIVHIIVIASETDQYAIDCHALNTKRVYAALKPLLETKLILAHNSAFDAKFAFHYGVHINQHHCTMITERMVSAGLIRPEGFSLKGIVSRYKGIPLSKEVRSEFIDNFGLILEKRHFDYACEDTTYLFDIYRAQIEQIREKELQAVYDLEMGLIQCTAVMEYTGIATDIDRLRSLVPPFEQMVKSAHRALQDQFILSGTASHILIDENGYTAVNLNSKPGKRKNKETGESEIRYGQVYEAFLRLGINPTDKKGNPSLGAKHILRWDMKHTYGKEYDYRKELDLNVDDEREDNLANAIQAFEGLKHPILRAFAFYIAATKLLDSYVVGTINKYNPATKRVYGWFNQLGARSTGRYSSDMQQIPQDQKLERLSIPYSIRGCFIAPRGRNLLIADYSGIELVILADLSRDETLADLVVKNAKGEDDIHLYVVRQAFTGLYPKAADATLANKGKKPFPYLRDAAKPTSYGIAYGITGIALSETITAKLAPMGVSCSIKQAEDVLNGWKYKAFPGAGKWLDNTARSAVVRGYTATALGRKRWYDLEHAALHEWKRHAIMREGSNAPIQGTSADMTKLAMRKIYSHLDVKRARIIWTVHDELIIESTAQYTKQASEIMRQGMEWAARQVLPMMGEYVKVKVNVSDRYNK